MIYYVDLSCEKRKCTTGTCADPEKPQYKTEVIFEVPSSMPPSEDSEIQFCLRDPSGFTSLGAGKIGNSKIFSLKDFSDNIEKKIQIFKNQQIVGSIFVKVSKRKYGERQYLYVGESFNIVYQNCSYLYDHNTDESYIIRIRFDSMFSPWILFSIYDPGSWIQGKMYSSICSCRTD